MCSGVSQRTQLWKFPYAATERSVLIVPLVFTSGRYRANNVPMVTDAEQEGGQLLSYFVVVDKLV